MDKRSLLTNIPEAMYTLFFLPTFQLFRGQLRPSLSSVPVTSASYITLHSNSRILFASRRLKPPVYFPPWRHRQRAFRPRRHVTSPAPWHCVTITTMRHFAWPRWLATVPTIHREFCWYSTVPDRVHLTMASPSTVDPTLYQPSSLGIGLLLAIVRNEKKKAINVVSNA